MVTFASYWNELAVVTHCHIIIHQYGMFNTMIQLLTFSHEFEHLLLRADLLLRLGTHMSDIVYRHCKHTKLLKKLHAFSTNQIPNMAIVQQCSSPLTSMASLSQQVHKQQVLCWSACRKPCSHKTANHPRCGCDRPCSVPWLLTCRI